MKDASYHVLRVGTAITFLWVGILISRDPEFWGGFLKPWAAGLLPVPLREAMIGTAALDFLIGFFLLIDSFVWIAALLGAFHLTLVLAVSGIDEVTVRDIGLLAGCIALIIAAAPPWLKAKVRKIK